MADERDRLGLPARPFFYTPEQISVMFNVTEDRVRRYYLFYRNRTPGVQRKDELECVNIAPTTVQEPDWRIEERELIRWMKYKGFRYAAGR